MAYLGNAPGVESQRLTTAFTATDGQTAFNPVGGYTLGYVDAYLNGVKLIDGTDYTADDGVTVTLSTGAALNDNVELVTYTPRGLSDGYTKTEADGRYVQPNDDVTLGDVTVGTFTSTGIDDNSTSTAITIDASENVGIGTTSPATKLDVEGTSPTIRISDTNTSSNWPDNQEMGRLEFFSQDSSGNSPYGTAYISAVNGLGGGTLASGELAFGTTAYNASGGAIERMRLTDEGYLGIGTSSPSSALHVKAPLESINGGIRLESADGTNYATIDCNNAGNLRFYQNGSAKMRLDSSGNLLVGKTALDSATDGVQLVPDGISAIARSSGEALRLTRNDNDGEILRFQKDGSTVGSIGSSNSDLMLGNSDVGLKFHDVNNTIYPWNVGSDTASDAQITLGADSIRFKDLYLSGGVVFGDAGGSGTSTSNTLDSYEEGTWTPAIGRTSSNPTVTYNYQDGKYTKIGETVYVTARVSWSSVSGGSGAFTINSLPFPFLNSTGSFSSPLITDYGGVNFVTNGTSLGGYGVLGNTHILLLNGKDDGGNSASIAGLASSGFIYVTMAYRT